MPSLCDLDGTGMIARLACAHADPLRGWRRQTANVRSQFHGDSQLET